MAEHTTSLGSICFIIISLACVLHVPLFPNQRDSENLSGWFGFGIGIFGIVILLLELLITFGFITKSKLIHWKRKFIRFCHHPKFWVPHPEGDDEYKPLRGNVVVPHRHRQSTQNFMSYFFFGILLIFKSFEAGLTLTRPDCFNSSAFSEAMTHLLLAFLLLIAINNEARFRSIGLRSEFVWSTLGAICTSIALRSIIDEVIWSYIHIVEESIEDRDYGLDIPPNIATSEEYVPKLLKPRARCWQHGSNSLYVLDAVPITTEYFALSASFCFIMWKNTGRHNADKLPAENRLQNNANLDDEKEAPINRHSDDEAAIILEPNNNEEPHEANVQPSLIQRALCLLKTLRKPISLAFLLPTLAVIGGTATTITFFMSEWDYTAAIQMFVAQITTLKIVILVVEIIFYVFLRARVEKSEIPEHYELDLNLLLLPLFPLGINLCLRLLPDFIVMENPSSFAASVDWVESTLSNVLRAVFFYFQLSFQAFFISQVLGRLKNLKKSCKPVFLFLSVLNFCATAIYVFEYNTVVLHWYSAKVYGILPWLVISYCTIPFIIFCFSHTATCFLQILSEF